MKPLDKLTSRFLYFGLEAVLENGILTLTIPKAEEATPKAIKVKVKGMLEGKKVS